MTCFDQIGRALMLLTATLLAIVSAACVGQVARDTPPVSVTAAGGGVVLAGGRAFAAAELAYITAADGVGRLARAGVIRGGAASQVRRWNAQARALLVQGHAAIDATEKTRIAAELFGIADRLDAFTKRK